MEKERYSGHHAGGTRDGKSYEILLADRFHLHIEAGESKSTACNEDEGSQPPNAAERAERPEIHENCGRDSESYEVGEGIVFDSKSTGSPCEACDFSVQDVEETGDENSQSSQIESAVDRTDYAEEAAEEIRRRKEVRYNISPYVNLSLFKLAPFLLPFAPSGAPFPYFSRHKSVSPP